MVDDHGPQSVEEVLAILRDAEEAADALSQSIRLNPNDVWALLKYGTLLTLCDDKKYARVMFERAAGLEPGLAAPHWAQGNLYRKQGEYDLAGRAYERAVEVDPKDEQAREKLAEWRAFVAKLREGTGDDLP